MSFPFNLQHQSSKVIHSLEALDVFCKTLVGSATFKEGAAVLLEGPLGAGKTSLVRSCLRALGFTGNVPSPSYSICNSYCIKGRRFHHYDLYRLKSVLEFIDLGVDEFRKDVLFIEWPMPEIIQVIEPSHLISITPLPDGRAAYTRKLELFTR